MFTHCRTFEFHDGEMNGILYSYNSRNSEEVFKTLVFADGSSSFKDRGVPYDVINLKNMNGSHNDWATNNEESSNLTINFLKNKVKISHYSLFGRHDWD